MLLTIKIAMLPHAAADGRLALQELGPGIARAALTFGFLDEPDVPQALALLPPDWRIDPMQVSYVLGRQVLVAAARPGMARWRETLFDAMIRLAGSAMEYYRLPPGRVMELGSQVEI